MPLQITPRTWLALVALGPAIFVAIQALPLLRSLFLLLLVSTLLALLIAPLADRLERRGVTRGLTTTVTLVALIVTLLGLLLMLVPVLIDSLRRLASSFDTLRPQLSAALGAASGSAEVAAVGNNVLRQIPGAISWAAGELGATIGRAGALGFAAFVAFAVVLALVGNRQTAPALLELLVPDRYRARVASLTHAASEGLSRWLIAQLAICVYYIVTYSATLLILDVPFALQIGVVSGLLEFIPYLGGLVGLVLSTVAAATVGPTTVLLVVLIEAVIGAVCVYFVAPYAFSRAVDVPPALILLGLFVGGLVGGFFAALLTVPLLSIAMVLYRELRPREPAPEVVTTAPEPAGD
ncbi:MAG: hypothetical protein OHK0015_31510 [Chloroflexi bacterium OHK40]